MRVTIVGAGAVGVTYAHLLARAGAEVSFLVREKYAASVRDGIRVYPGAGRREERLVPHRVVTSERELDAEQVWLAVPTTGFDEASLGALKTATKDATVVDLMPDPDERAKKVFGDRAVEGSIPFVAWQTPIPHSNEARAPGIAYWFPPFARVRFAGARAQACAELLRRGGVRTQVVADMRADRAFSRATMCFIWHTEAAGWSAIGGLRRYDTAAREALAIAERETGVAPGARTLTTAPWLMHLGAPFVPLVRPFLPFPVDPYLRYHFTKVGGQSHRGLQALIDKADAYGMAAPGLRGLADRILGAKS
jgi:2-dehydropantoate 2-reductase